MKKIGYGKSRVALATLLFYFCMEQSCSQNSGTFLIKNYVATSPCNDAVKEMLGIPADFICEMIKWNLSLKKGLKNSPSAFDLTYTYGTAKQGTRRFTEGAKTVELKGNWRIEKGNSENSTATIITLTADKSPLILSFSQLGENLLHLLDKSKELVIGTGAWSYTLNRTDSLKFSQAKVIPRPASSMHLSGVSDTVGIFYGRTPCDKALRDLNNISAEGCQVVKCRLILLQDTNNHIPTDFILNTVYVGKGDNIYTSSGTWKLLQGTIDAPNGIVYQLLPGNRKSEIQLLLFKADDNILYFIDNDTNLLVGGSYTSYTLNRGK